MHSSTQYPALVSCIYAGDASTVRRLLLTGALTQKTKMLNTPYGGQTPFMIAIDMQSNLEQLHEEGEAGNTRLLQQGVKEIIELLLACPELDVLRKDPENNSAITMAINRGDLDLFNKLLQRPGVNEHASLSWLECAMRSQTRNTTNILQKLFTLPIKWTDNDLFSLLKTAVDAYYKFGATSRKQLEIKLNLLVEQGKRTFPGINSNPKLIQNWIKQLTQDPPQYSSILLPILNQLQQEAQTLQTTAAQADSDGVKVLCRVS